MAGHDIVVIGASAGGLQALTSIVERLPADLDASVFVVLHTRPDGTGILPDLLSRISAMPVAFARDGERIRRGRIYVAAADYHLLLTPTAIRLVHGPRENGFRPAIDPLFRTAAHAFGPRVVGVVLSGALGDGTYGLSVIKHAGGLAVVQSPDDAIIPSMPLNAIREVEVDYILRAEEIPALLPRLSEESTEAPHEEESMARKNDIEPQRRDVTEVSAMEGVYGAASALTCPDCGGALWEIQDGRVLRYQCHVGHQYAPDSLEAEQRDAVDGALWSAVRVLEEHAELKMRMARRAAAGGLSAVSDSFEEGARDAHTQAQHIRTLLFAGNGTSDTPDRLDVPVSRGNGSERGRALATASDRVAIASRRRRASRPAATRKTAAKKRQR